MWTLNNDQYDDLEGAAERILFSGNDHPEVGGYPLIIGLFNPLEGKVRGKRGADVRPLFK